jgi:hypothetical protein
MNDILIFNTLFNVVLILEMITEIRLNYTKYRLECPVNSSVAQTLFL